MSTFTPISTQTLSADTATITFSGIPQTYTDLFIVADTQITNNDFMVALRFNGDSSTLYSYTTLNGDGSAASSGRRSNMSLGTLQVVTSNASRTVCTVSIMNYSNTTTNKTYISRASQAGRLVSANVGLYRSTSAITSVTISEAGDGGSGSFTGTLKAGSSFTLYGIGAGSPKAFGGDEVTTDGTFWYHIYRSSGVFAPMQNLSCDYLVVAGGGGGGGELGGGGGAGGMRCTVTATGGTGSLESPLSVVSGTNYAVIIGAGGSAGLSTTFGGLGGNGSDSVFSTITSTGGGAGARSVNSTNGGSGGGAGEGCNPGTGSSNQGYNGGDDGGSAGPGYGAGGGGGAGAAGTAGTNTTGGNGGNGRTTSISGSSITYAGGGGGGVYSFGSARTSGSGGNGGGGNAGPGTLNTDTSGTPGVANTGGGGGGATRGSNDSSYLNGGAGGSGIVIVRYAV
jgi:hypothetical protein